MGLDKLVDGVRDLATEVVISNAAMVQTIMALRAMNLNSQADTCQIALDLNKTLVNKILGIGVPVAEPCPDAPEASGEVPE